MRAVLFDLDDTLYPEMEFVRSGFRAVAVHLAARYRRNENSLFARLCDILERDGRGKVFDTLLRELGLYTRERVRVLVYLYRSHRPSLRCAPAALRVLRSLRRRGMRLGIVTDGMASVQRRKITALGLEKLFHAIVCTDELGDGCAKPSPAPYRVACELIGVPPPETAYVADDPAKDFIAPNAMGMMTIQVGWKVPHARGGSAGEGALGCVTVDTLKEILPLLKGRKK